MNPYISFHNIKSLELTPITAHAHKGGERFWSRHLRITDIGGNTVDLPLFSETREGIEVFERPYEWTPEEILAQEG